MPNIFYCFSSEREKHVWINQIFLLLVGREYAFDAFKYIAVHFNNEWIQNYATVQYILGISSAHSITSRQIFGLEKLEDERGRSEHHSGWLEQITVLVVVRRKVLFFEIFLFSHYNIIIVDMILKETTKPFDIIFICSANDCLIKHEWNKYKIDE